MLYEGTVEVLQRVVDGRERDLFDGEGAGQRIAPAAVAVDVEPVTRAVEGVPRGVRVVADRQHIARCSVHVDVPPLAVRMTHPPLWKKDGLNLLFTGRDHTPDRLGRWVESRYLQQFGERSSAEREWSVASPVAGTVMAHDLHVVPLMQGRQPGLRAAGLAAAYDDVAAAGLQRGRAVARLPVDRDQARGPRVPRAALLRDQRQTYLFHASIQTRCRTSRNSGRP